MTSIAKEQAAIEAASVTEESKGASDKPKAHAAQQKPRVGPTQGKAGKNVWLCQKSATAGQSTSCRLRGY
jgi:hypothetical protein